MAYNRDQLINMFGLTKAMSLLGEIKPIKKAKYNNEKVGGVDSKKEYGRKQELILLQKAGKIQDLKYQIPFLLQNEFNRNNEKIKKIEYFADFVYLKIGDKKYTVEDSKGVRTEVFKIKRKMFLLKYGDEYNFIET